MKKKIYFILIAIVILIQFYPMDKPTVTIDNPNDLLATTTVPDNISTLLKNACYDCHSNESTFPWYSNVAPVKWMLYDHIYEAREELNFSNWNSLETDDKADLLDDISSMVLEGEMPLKGYTILHSEANLSEEDRELIATWADEMLDLIYE
ncbi:MAG: heme-binding domain-containing protein [Flavobacteriaceae bacterium]|nr:heme-binding domain-containing protein [Flavobacteriaceae bacterium]